MLFNVPLAIIAEYTADAASVLYTGRWMCPALRVQVGNLLILISLFSLFFFPQKLSDTLSDLSTRHFGTRCWVSVVMP